MDPNAPLTPAPDKPDAAASFFAMTGEQRLQVMLEQYRHIKELTTRMDSLQAAADLADRRASRFMEERNAAEERYVKAKDENDALEQEVADRMREIECRKENYARLQAEYDAAKPFIRVPGATVPIPAPRRGIPRWSLVVGVGIFWVVCAGLLAWWWIYSVLA